jgi:hypothetical protein
MSWCKKNPRKCGAVVLVAVFVLNYLDVINLSRMWDSLLEMLSLKDGFTNAGGGGVPSGVLNAMPDMAAPVAAEEGAQEGQLAVKGLTRTPATCYPQQTLKPADLLPASESQAIQEFNSTAPVAEGIMAGNLLDAGSHIGVNTVGQSLRNANRQLRSEPPNPQVNVSPWQNTTIGPDLQRRPLEIAESCGL